MWLFPQIRPCNAPPSCRAAGQSATRGCWSWTAGAGLLERDCWSEQWPGGHIRRGSCGDETLQRDTLLQHRDRDQRDPSAWGYSRAELTHRNHHAGQVRLNSRGAGITPVGLLPKCIFGRVCDTGQWLPPFQAYHLTLK